ncbi:MAG: hypothetical protein IMZ75_02970, partial [Actinobacteria bacterium]|nr:hypothetical protein [Actinomycetota bacterium]
DALFPGKNDDAGDSVTYSFPALDQGEYPFLCRIHPVMRGTVTAK